jgi:hypothetical protein
MPIGSAVLAILSLSFSIALLKMGSDTKLYRLWWMDLLGVLDVDSDREARKAQERQMALMCYLLFFLLIGLCVSCIYWTVDGVREVRRDKSLLELEIDMGRREIEVVRQKFGG